MNSLEVRRQAIHFSGISIAFTAMYYGAVGIGLLCTAGSALLMVASGYASSQKKRRTLLGKLSNRLLPFERSDARPFLGAIAYLAGVGLSLVTFPSQAALSVTVLSVGDSVSTLVGVRWGRHKLHFNKAKSYEGLLAGFLLSFTACLVFTTPSMALAASFIGMLIEALPIKVNDNISVPIGVGAFMGFLPS